LEEIDIPLNDKIEITDNYTEESIKNAILWAQHPSTQIKTTLVQAIKWACKAGPQIAKNEDQQKEENRDYALKYNGMECGNVKIDVLSKLVSFEWSIPCASPCFCLEFDTGGFKEKFIERLKRHKFPIMLE